MPGPVCLVPASIDATGTVEAAAALSDFFATVAPGSTVRFPTGGRYLCEGVVTAKAWESVTIEGNGSTIIARTTGAANPPPDAKPDWPRSRKHLFLDGGADVTVRGLNVQGPNTGMVYDAGLENQSGFTVSGVDGCVLDGIGATDVYGDFVTVSNGARNVVVQNGRFSGAGRQGFSCSEGTNVVFQTSVLARVARSGVDIEPLQLWRVDGVTVRLCDFYAPIGNFILANGGSGWSGGVTFERNRVFGQSLTMLVGSPSGRRPNYRILGNWSDTTHTRSNPVRVAYVDGLVLRGNTASTRVTGKTGASTPSVWALLTDVTGVVEGNNDGGEGTLAGTYTLAA